MSIRGNQPKRRKKLYFDIILMLSWIVIKLSVLMRFDNFIDDPDWQKDKYFEQREKLRIGATPNKGHFRSSARFSNLFRRIHDGVLLKGLIT